MDHFAKALRFLEEYKSENIPMDHKRIIKIRVKKLDILKNKEVLVADVFHGVDLAAEYIGDLASEEKAIESIKINIIGPAGELVHEVFFDPNA